MHRYFWTIALLVCAVVSPAYAQDDRAAVRIRFGMKAQDNTDWSGTITPASGKVDSIRGWRWMAGDKAEGNNFTVMVRRQQPQSAADRRRVQSGQKLPMTDNGIIVNFSGVKSDDAITFDSKGGKFAFKLSDLPYGKKLMELDGTAEVMRVPVAAEVSATADDEDYPAMAVGKDGTMYLAYVSFTRGKDFQGPRERPQTAESGPNVGPMAQGEVKKLEKPEDFDYLAQPAGGEKIVLRIGRDGNWGDAIEVSSGEREVYRPAVAVDGGGKVWVFYSAHRDADEKLDHGNWELMGRAFDAQGKAAGEATNISNAPGSDFMPAAATDSNGKVAVAWVGGREKNFNVFYAMQEGEKFSQAKRVSDLQANEWEPAIAASGDGRVAIAWDTYAKGDYDVYVSHRGTDGAFAKPQAVAATLAFEVRPTVAYDNQNRLWIAWEESGDQWGKDWGALKKKGIGLYNGGRAIGMMVQTPDEQWHSVADVMDAMVSNAPRNRRGAAGATTQRMANPIAPCFPRLAADAKGQIFLAFRGRPGGNWRVGVGSVWNEYVTRLEGEGWTPAIWVPRSNNILDNRPAVAASSDGLAMVYSGDGRGEMNPPRVGDPHLRGSADGDDQVEAAVAQEQAEAGDDDGAVSPIYALARPNRGGGRNAAAGEINVDIFATMVKTADFESPAGEAQLTKADAAKPAEQAADIEDEKKAVAAIRDFRLDLNGEKLRIWRGEFHRHTELSPDGGNDGGLLDMWRYGIDACALDWIGDGDHDYGIGREYSWWTTQKAVTLFTLPGQFVPVYSYERSVSYPEGHRNCMFAQRGVRSLPRLPITSADEFKPAPDTNMFYMYLKRFNGLCASHTSATDMGTDWRNWDAEVEPFVEIYQGDRNNYERPDSPRSAVTEAKLKQSTPEKESLGGWRPKGFVNLALLKGYRLAFQASSDHISTHLSYCNVFIPADKEPTRASVLDAIRKKRVYGATDNIIADVRCKVGDKEHFMGEEFSTSEAPKLDIHIVGAQKIAKVVIIKDDVEVHSVTPNEKDVKLSWTDPSPTSGKVSYYYVRGEQTPDMEGASSGELVWASPMWIKYDAK